MPTAATDVILALLDNQVNRTVAAFEGLSDAELGFFGGGDCQSIRGIAAHLLELREFQLFLLESPLAGSLPKLGAEADLAAIMKALGEAERLVRKAVIEHDPTDWFTPPTSPRTGPWSQEPTIVRVIRPMNDFTNHLGAVRAMRRMAGNPAARTQ